jgi:hypothetical protein
MNFLQLNNPLYDIKIEITIGKNKINTELMIFFFEIS